MCAFLTMHSILYYEQYEQSPLGNLFIFLPVIFKDSIEGWKCTSGSSYQSSSIGKETTKWQIISMYIIIIFLCEIREVFVVKAQKSSKNPINFFCSKKLLG